MILQNCFYCHNRLRTAHYVCEVCSLACFNLKIAKTQVRASASGLPFNIFSIFHYHGILRELVILAKVKKNFFAHQWLVALFLEHNSRPSLAFDFIMPAPSSLFSRLKGNFDVAYGLAFAFSVETQVKIASAPKNLGWALKKQSRKSLDRRAKIRAENKSDIFRKKEDLSGARILLIDDVTTSGQTLLELANSIPQAKSITAITLASAF